MHVRKAGILDISSLILLLAEMHKNVKLSIPKINSELLVDKISQAIHKGVVFVVLDDKNIIKGSIGGMIGSDWWSEDKYLADLWFYVTPDYRKSNAASELVKNFMKVAKDSKIPVRLGHVFSGDIDRKDNFFSKLGLVKAGSIFVEV
jgi:N-acetylglutamate synthase-like GNAT family acetyltransferase|tara:strand:+ start:434 stop:874 length:441 start_codon:yes stop_codon:yes gene_type:complete